MTDWRSELGGFIKNTKAARKAGPEGSEATRFIADVGIPALKELRAELEKHGREVTIRESESSATLIVYADGAEEITYRIQFRPYPDRVLPIAEIRVRERKGLRLVSFESMIRSGKPDYRMADVGREEIIKHFLEQYRQRTQTD
jgi:hypothetical protein